MKKYLLLIASVVFLIACGSDGEEEAKTNEASDANDEAVEYLVEVGQKKYDHYFGTEIELVAIEEINEVIDLFPLTLTIHDIKVIHVPKIETDEYRAYMEDFTNKETFDYIQIAYTLENTVDEHVKINYPIKHLVLNTGEQIDVNISDFLKDENNGGEFLGKDSKFSGIATVIENANVEDIESIKIITDEVLALNGDLVTEQVEETYELN